MTREIDAELPAVRQVPSQSETDPRIRKTSVESWRDHFSLTNPKLWIAVIVVAVSLIVGYLMGEQIYAYITQAKDWFRDQVPVSIVWYYVLITLASLVLAPYGPFCVSVGFVFGFEKGLLIQFGALLISNVALFAVGRYLLRDKVEEHLKQYKVWKGLMHMIGTDWKEAAKINLLLCFMPIPYGTHAYLFALSTVPFSHFISVFMVGMQPATIIDLLIGQELAEASDPGGSSMYHIIGTGLVICALVVAVMYASSVAQRVLDEAEEGNLMAEEASLIPEHSHRRNP